MDHHVLITDDEKVISIKVNMVLEQSNLTKSSIFNFAKTVLEHTHLKSFFIVDNPIFIKPRLYYPLTLN
jgi:hypothetical protein